MTLLKIVLGAALPWLAIAAPAKASDELTQPASTFAANSKRPLTPIDLGTLGGRTSIARDINGAAMVVGESEDGGGRTQAFLWQNGTMRPLSSGVHAFGMANGLNDRGQIVGYVGSRAGAGIADARAALWTDNTLVILPSFGTDAYAQASELNDSEEIIGISGGRAVVWRERRPERLPTLGGSYSAALGINARGWIVGNSENAEGRWHACLWRDGVSIDLGTLGGSFSNANGINDDGTIVGTSETTDGTVHGFLWREGVMRDLGPGMVRAINSQEWMAGERDGPGQPYGFLESEDGSSRELQPLANGGYTTAMALNESNFVVGVTAQSRAGEDTGADYRFFHATLWSLPVSRQSSGLAPGPANALPDHHSR